MNELATARPVLALIDEYDEKAAGVEKAIAAYEAACTTIEMAGCVMGTYIEPVLRHKNYLYPERMRKNLLKSGWKAIYDRLSIETIASANDKRLFERTLSDPPPLTFENAKATFGPYLENPRAHILRGLAETFAELDPAYRSHSKVKIGVEGLPKRVVIQSFGGYGSYGRDKVRDILNALAALRREPLVEHKDFAEIDALHSYIEQRSGEATIRGQRLKRYKNGNGHLYFDADALLDINRGLAEFYGDVLPDAEEEGVKPRASTDVAKDLQFYWSPDKVISAALEFAGLTNRREWRRSDPPPMLRVLEPSCGDGRIMDMVKAYGHRCFGYEYHAGRAATAKAKGHPVICANFLEVPPLRDYDVVVMNPPFYGRHYVKHVRHALKWLKPGGTLVAILPATAHYDHEELEGTWEDLPVASFADAGTNVPTGLLKMRA